ncbi:putative RNA-binding protein YlmH [Alicyclobacillus contaminans]|uniref:YlmH family RNA-binding protein n=1 Tax=Alicyclobacillus contaminans TaxID=392016 RepID=UPI0003FAE56D|nr:YlmH/Sll1252 family protein [Alicyclobacillus contaminans]GMA49147.1 putative RNA-binding protein YlmH [Alicyclobacillus contaminans]
MSLNEAFVKSWTRPEERPFIRRCLDVVGTVVSDNRWRLTDFLTPREQYLCESVVRREGAWVEWHGVIPNAERKRGLVMPDNWYPTPDDFETEILFARCASGAALSHRATLGSLLGTGLERRKIGDVVIQDGGAYVVVCRDVAGFLLTEWTKAGRESLAVERRRGPETWAAPEYQDVVISVSSLRLDGVVAQACHWSRSAAQAAVEKGYVQLNFAVVDKPDMVVEPGDMLSIRGFGRVRVDEHLGESRKGRERLRIGVLPSER